MKLPTKAELKAGQDRRVKLQTHHLSYFLGKIFFGDEWFLKCLFISQHLVCYS